MLLTPFRWAVRLLSLLIVAIVLYYVVSLAQVWLTSRHYDPHHAGAIVVMGSAHYGDSPSRDLAARLNEAVTLYRAGDAPYIMVTGGKEKGDEFTEAQASAAYLENSANHVPGAAILQAGGSNTYGNWADATPLLRAHHIRTVLVSTDPFHEDESMAIASHFGFDPSPTPTQDSPIKGWSTVPYFLKEAVGVAIGRIIGFNHLGWLHDA